MESFLDVEVLLGFFLSLTISWLFCFSYGRCWADLGLISPPRRLPMNACYTAGRFTVMVFCTKQVLFTALECHDSARTLGFR